MRRRELADDYASREAAGIMTCGETYFMALRAARWDRQTNTPHPSRAEKKKNLRKRTNIMLLELKDQTENGPA